MVFPYTSWPTSVDPIADRTDGSDVIFAADLEYQDDQIRTIQTWLGYAGRFIGGDIAGAGATGIVSPEATGGVAFTIAARQNFTSGTLLSVGDDYNGVYTEWFSVEYNGQAYVDGNRVLTEDAAEFASITEKATPVSADLLLIEDSEDANSKKRVQVGNLPGGGGASDGRGFAIVIGNSLAGDTSDICDYLDVGDCVQLKAGIEAAAGKPVYIRPGTYDWNNGAATSNQITVPAGTRVLGAGMNAVTVRLLDAATEAQAFVLQGGGSVLEEFEISIPTPTALATSGSSQGYIYATTGTGSAGLNRVRVVFEDDGWSTLAGDFTGMRYVVYSDFGGDRLFVQDCEFIDVINYESTPPAFPRRMQIMACYGQVGTLEVRGTFSWGGYQAYELAGDEVVFSDNIAGSIAYEYALKLIGNGFSSGTERPARVVNNDIVMLYDPAENAEFGILCFTNVGFVAVANNFTLEGGTHANATAIDVSSSDRATIVGNRFDAESGWQYAVDCGSGSTGTIVANHLGSATITGTTAGWSIGLNYPGGGITDSNAIHDNVAAEISAVAAKATPTTSDYILIEDAAAGDAKKSITIGNLPAATPAAHDLGGAEHNSATLAQLNAKVSDATLDDASDPRDPNAHTLGGAAHSSDTLANLNAKISDATLDDSSSPRTDNDAIHDNVTGEINALTEKASPVGADLLIIEDSAAGNAKKKVQITNLPGGADADAIHDNVAGEIAAVTEKTTPVSADLLLIEDSADSNNKKKVQIGNLPGGSTAAAAESTSYRELASNAFDTQGPSVVENDVGEGVFNAGLHQSILFRATLTASWATTGTLTVSLYDDGPTSAPGTPRLVTSFAKTADGGYEVFEQALTIVSSGAGSNQVLGEARVYRVTIEVDGTTGDTGYIGSAGFAATGSAETLSADQIQAIVMSLNA